MTVAGVQEICADLAAEQDALDGLVAELDEQSWDRATPAEGWAVRDQVSHLAWFDGAARLAVNDHEALAAAVAGVTGTDELMAIHLRKGRGLSPAELLAWWRGERAALLVTVAGRVLRWATTHFVLTTERLIFRSGLVAKFGREIPLERINDVTFSQSLFERLVGVGDLLIESAGEHGQSRFSNIRDPETVQLEIYRQMEANDRRRAGYATTQPHHPVGHPAADRTPTPPTRGSSALDDLERLADLRDRGVVTEEEFQRMKRELLDRM
jgi:hypothetical protein